MTPCYTEIHMGVNIKLRNMPHLMMLLHFLKYMTSYYIEIDGRHPEVYVYDFTEKIKLTLKSYGH